MTLSPATTQGVLDADPAVGCTLSPIESLGLASNLDRSSYPKGDDHQIIAADDQYIPDKYPIPRDNKREVLPARRLVKVERWDEALVKELKPARCHSILRISTDGVITVSIAIAHLHDEADKTDGCPRGITGVSIVFAAVVELGQDACCLGKYRRRQIARRAPPVPSSIHTFTLNRRLNSDRAPLAGTVTFIHARRQPILSVPKKSQSVSS